MAEKRIVPKCVEWTAKGSCAKWVMSAAKGLGLDLRACKKEEKEEIRRELKRGVLIKDDEE